MKNGPVVLSQDVSADAVLRDFARVVQGAAVVLDEDTSRMLQARREQVARFVDRNPGSTEPAYGFNRGFGHNVGLAVPEDKRGELQLNLIRSHSSGVGDPAPIEVVRGTMYLRAVSLARGHSGVRPQVVQALLDLLNAGITPLVPRLGSVSASGDLAPLSHVALALLGEGEVFYKGERRSASSALADSGLAGLGLEMKEGLALNNGVQYSTAYGLWCLDRMDVLLKSAAIATALSAQVMLGADTPFRSDLHDLRPHRGSRMVAGWLFELMAKSPLRDSHRDFDVDGEIQDPYNLRCAPQILGACAELLQRARDTFAIEASSVTDNPIILKAGAEYESAFKDEKAKEFVGSFVDIVSGGHFHGMPVAVDLYGLLQACGIICRLSNMRAVRYIDGHRNKGLGSDLKPNGDLEYLKWAMRPDIEPGLPDDFRRHVAALSPRIEALEAEQAVSSTFMIPEYVSAALTNWIWGACMPSHLFSLSTDAGQEDHVSMAANVAVRLQDSLPRVAEVIAIELALGSQAASLRRAMRCIPSRLKKWHPLREDETGLNPVGEAVLEVVRAHFPVVERDRPLGEETGRLAEAVLNGAIVEAAETNGFSFAGMNSIH